MKRYFQPVSKNENGGAKKPKPADNSDSASASYDEPRKFMSWNANNLLTRLKKDRQQVVDFVQRFDPDVIAVQVLIRALSSSPFSNYRVCWSLSDTKYGGTALFVKHQFHIIKVSFSLDQPGSSSSKHEADGRVIIAEFNSFRVHNSYMPNNGWKDDELGFQRRRKWDRRMQDFVLQVADKPLIWCGDLNVSHENIDVSHPEFFSNARMPGYIPPNKEDCGQPGFTLSERRRFSTILKMGKLIDSYRWLHKEPEPDNGYSWSGNPVGKYRGKRMRIDYFIVSEALKNRIIAADIHGRGIEMEGFLGSDHCPISLELSANCKSSEEPETEKVQAKTNQDNRQSTKSAAE